MSGNNRNNHDTAAAPSTTNASASAGSTGTAAQDPVNGQPIATRQLQDRAITILENNQLIMRYAVANNLSVPKVRVYFEKVAGGFGPEPIITKWNIFED
ncbi:hypothetical protein LTR24_006735 [Lithohypha guttulata]|uniref:Uncharacterized protein n=1 Tax=Lithohypha guttulata TaxID=1690604 RepID=A0ABR0K5F3_9EURO|nr:hypothetical protein LTR24_006735 [Lithohypha guttulata]